MHKPNRTRIRFVLGLLICTGSPTVYAQQAEPVGMAAPRVSATGFPKAPTLQSIVDRPGATIDVPYGEYVLDLPLLLRSNLNLRFAPGTRVSAAKGAFRGIDDALVVIAGVENVVIQADECTFKMRKDDYQDEKLYKSSEWRHVVTIRGSKNIAIIGGRYESSGGDGIYIGPLITASQRTPCENVQILGVTCNDNFRQGISVLNGKNLLIADSLLSGTAGTSPQAGIDVEPEYGDFVDIVVRNCLSKGNRGPAYMVNLSKISRDSSAHIEFHDCVSSGVPADQVEFRVIGVFDDRGRILDNLPAGTYLSWNGLVWKK